MKTHHTRNIAFAWRNIFHANAIKLCTINTLTWLENRCFLVSFSLSFWYPCNNIHTAHKNHSFLSFFFLFHYYSISFFLSFNLFLSLPILSLSLSFSLFLALSRSFSLFLALLALSRSLSLFIALFHSFSLFLALSRSLSLFLALSRSCRHSSWKPRKHKHISTICITLRSTNDPVELQMSSDVDVVTPQHPAIPCLCLCASVCLCVLCAHIEHVDSEFMFYNIFHI